MIQYIAFSTRCLAGRVPVTKRQQGEQPILLGFTLSPVTQRLHPLIVPIAYAI